MKSLFPAFQKLLLACAGLSAGYGLLLTAYAANWPRAELRSSFDETLREEVPLSGTVLVGVAVPAAANSYANNESPPILVFVPSSIDTTDLCVTVRSRDGRYRAQNRYKLTPDAQGVFVQLEFPTQYPKLLQTFRKDDVAVLAASGSCNNRKPKQFLPAAWGEPAENATHTLELSVNGGRKKVTAEIVGTNMAPQKCRRIREAHRKAFDTTCALAISPELGPDIEVKLTEYRLGANPVGWSTHRIGIGP